MVFDMPLDSIALNTIEDLYTFVESSTSRTALVIAADALFRPWVRTVSAECNDVRWLCLDKPLSQDLLQHLSNLAHSLIPDKGFVLLENGRIIKAVDVEVVDGVSQPHRLGTVVRQSFANAKSQSNKSHPSDAIADPYRVLEAVESDSEDEIKRKYKQMIMQYHPDRVAHLGVELKKLAAEKTTEINAAFSAIRRTRGF
jgi:hypothetical protein